MLRPQIQSHATNGVYQTNLKLAFDQIKLALMTHRFISIVSFLSLIIIFNYKTQK